MKKSGFFVAASAAVVSSYSSSSDSKIHFSRQVKSLVQELEKSWELNIHNEYSVLMILNRVWMLWHIITFRRFIRTKNSKIMKIKYSQQIFSSHDFESRLTRTKFCDGKINEVFWFGLQEDHGSSGYTDEFSCTTQAQQEQKQKQIKNSKSSDDKFAPRFDGLRFIETLVTAHR